MSRDAASVTLVGRAGSHPQLSMGSTGDRVSLRVVATERRFDKTADDWVNGDEFGVTVVCWKTLATAVLNTVRKGDPVIVGGRIATRRFEKDGVTQYFTEVKADFVGLDVAKAGNRFTRIAAEPREGVASVTQPNTSEVAVDRADDAQGFGDRLEPPDDGDFPSDWEVGDGAAIAGSPSLAAG